MTSKMPPELLRGNHLSATISFGLEKPEPTVGEGVRVLGRWVLPPFQRPPVWSRDQKIKFLESIWLGLPISVYVYNESPTYSGTTDYWLIDGQQRWTSIYDYVADKFPVFGIFYSNLDLPDRRRFTNNTVFPCILTKTDDQSHLEELYYHLAYGGTPHTRTT